MKKFEAAGLTGYEIDRTDPKDERIAYLEAENSELTRGAIGQQQLVDELRTERAYLERALEQAITVTGMRRYTITEEPNFICAHKVQMQHTDSVPDLARYLQEKQGPSPTLIKEDSK